VRRQRIPEAPSNPQARKIGHKLSSNCEFPRSGDTFVLTSRF
jgi:hypothetical protein